MRILIVDDDPISRALLEALLAPLGVCESAASGEEAIEHFNKALASAQPYRLVVLDIMMPGLDGLATLKALRAKEAEHEIYGNDGARVLMCSALAEKETVVKAFREGCEGYVIKPVQRDDLYARLQSIGINTGAGGKSDKKPSS